ncbi:MAG TPA: decarboxylating 6-phosphogluconate dehydrogenase [Dehalococcoidia bacterium]|nr:decarboxylating 6-phosphogluconate dehydrogenase [Dehalococcoidia bacterium]
MNVIAVALIRRCQLRSRRFQETRAKKEEHSMELGMIGLGRMGSNMTLRLLRGGHEVVVYDPIEESVKYLAKEGASGAGSVAELVGKLSAPRVVWVMVPAGEAAENAINTLAAELTAGDTIIDGGNSNYKDSMRRGTAVAERGIHFLDVGTSGGIWGLEGGYCLMVGGDSGVYQRLEPIFQTLAPSPQDGYGHVGPSGAGHFVKMVHNGVEYALMEAYAEGLELMRAKQDFSLNLAQISQIWRYGSVVRSWLLDLTSAILQEDPDLHNIQAYVEDTGEGRWTVEEAVNLGVPIPAIIDSVQVRFRSRQESPFSGRLMAAMRKEFGGHAVRTGEG